MFDNTRGDGYAYNPFNGSETLLALAKTMSTAWVNFAITQDPNGPKGLDLPSDSR